VRVVEKEQGSMEFCRLRHEGPKIVTRRSDIRSWFLREVWVLVDGQLAPSPARGSRGAL